jgi:hypothetical protein
LAATGTRTPLGLSGLKAPPVAESAAALQGSNNRDTAYLLSKITKMSAANMPGRREFTIGRCTNAATPKESGYRHRSVSTKKVIFRRRGSKMENLTPEIITLTIGLTLLGIAGVILAFWKKRLGLWLNRVLDQCRKLLAALVEKVAVEFVLRIAITLLSAMLALWPEMDFILRVFGMP